jgi:hypothetical protein
VTPHVAAGVVDLSVPVGRAAAALLARAAAAFGVPALSPLRAALVLVMATAAAIAVMALLPLLVRRIAPRYGRRAPWASAPCRTATSRPSSGAPADTPAERTRALAAAGVAPAEIARRTGVARDAVAVTLHLHAS